MMNPAWFDATVFAALHRVRRISNAVELFVSDCHDKGRHAAGRQAHFAVTIGARGHVIDGSSPFLTAVCRGARGKSLRRFQGRHRLARRLSAKRAHLWVIDRQLSKPGFIIEAWPHQAASSR